MKEPLLRRLEAFGLMPRQEQEALLSDLLEKAKHWLLAETGQIEIPPQLYGVVIDRAVGEYLLLQKAQGGLEGFDTEHAVRQISQGDTSVTYAVANEGGSVLDQLIARLMTPPAAVLHKWRRLRW